MSTRLAFVSIVAAASLGLTAIPRVAQADEFLLASGGRITGEFLNSDQSPRTTYEVKLAAGGTVTFAKDQVQEVLRRPATAAEYETIRHQHPDTVEGQLALAEWCREHKLTEQRKEHLRRVIEIEPNHSAARVALGYNQLKGQWKTQAEHMTALGKVLYKGQWRYPLEIEIIETREKQEFAERTWIGNLKKLRDKMEGNSPQTAEAAVAAINDPTAVPALKQFIEREGEPEKWRELYVQALAKIGTGDAQMILAERALRDPSGEIRTTSLELLAQAKRKPFVDYFIQKLHDGDNTIVNRAGIALSYFKEPRSVAPLIEALKTKHKIDYVSGSPGISAGLGTGGSGLSTGQSVRTEIRIVDNDGVLAGLLSVIDTKVNYRFEVEDWKRWYSAQKKQRLIDVRRS